MERLWMRIQHLRQKKRGGVVVWGVCGGVSVYGGMEVGVGMGTRAVSRAARAAGAVEGKLKRSSRKGGVGEGGKGLLHKAQREEDVSGAHVVEGDREGLASGEEVLAGFFVVLVLWARLGDRVGGPDPFGRSGLGMSFSWSIEVGTGKAGRDLWVRRVCGTGMETAAAAL
ncbi:hypothetical protein Q9189_007957 [Teloschistes chrysophthalmus]